MKRGEPGLALQQFEQAGKQNPANVEALIYQGIVLMDSDRIPQATKILESVVHHPCEQSKPAYLLLAIAYRRADNIRAAIKIVSTINGDPEGSWTKHFAWMRGTWRR
ncbi:MAG: hypothetical protein P4M11_14430 [Candidatus Pacebacteria bacterium]|nr:hypothetical protein [Candidatus Paceibacterota bacterium]